jgi:demethylmenaquinone methyltransferase/2-methoxy-6-polyprenyl-1,4-benzoquinol methylase
MTNKEELTHFGYQKVPAQEKASRVRSVFDSVASKYDVMNDVMSMGMHRLWKRYAVKTAQIRPGQTILDLAGGTGDITRLIADELKGTGKIVLADINYQMLEQGRERLLNQGLAKVEYVLGNAEALPFPDNYFDRVFIGFGLRNVTHKENALKSINRVLRPGGRLIVLEFSRPNTWLQPIYDQYSFKLVPKFGEWITDDRESYQYLVESIRMHPDQPTLAKMLSDAGFFKVQYENLTGGIVALHTGYKV